MINRELILSVIKKETMITEAVLREIFGISNAQLNTDIELGTRNSKGTVDFTFTIPKIKNEYGEEVVFLAEWEEGAFIHNLKVSSHWSYKKLEEILNNMAA